MNGRDEVVSARVPDDWAAKMDHAAEALSKTMGTNFGRSDIVRMAIAKYLGITASLPADDSGEPQTAP
jgi:predicted transcriptional regulator